MANKFLFVSDLHSGLRLPHAKVQPDASTSDRLEDVLNVLGQIKKHADHDPDIRAIFILGDVFDKEHPDAPTLIRTARALVELTKNENELMDPADEIRPIYLLPGNHDAHDLRGSIYSLDLFKELKVPGLKIIDRNKPIKIGNFIFWGIPWVPEKMFAEHLHQLQTLKVRNDEHPKTKKAARKNILLMHQTVIGAMEGGFVAKAGLSGKLIAGFDRVLSGHIHKHQFFDTANGTGLGMYLGSPMAFRFTDATDEPDQDRGFWIMDDEGELERVPVVAPGFVRWIFVEDEDFTVKESCTEVLPDLLEEMEDHLRERPIYLEVQIEGFRDEVEEVAKLVTLGVTDLDRRDKLRMCRFDRRMLDDGASVRVRKILGTAPGSVTNPKTLCETFVTANATKIAEDDLKAEDLLNFLEVEGVLS